MPMSLATTITKTPLLDYLSKPVTKMAHPQPPSFSTPPRTMYTMTNSAADWSSIVDPMTTTDTTTHATTISQINLDSITKEVVSCAISPYLYTNASTCKLDQLNTIINYKLNEMTDYISTRGYKINPDSTATGPTFDLKYNSWISDYNFDKTTYRLSINVNTANYSVINTQYQPYGWDETCDYYTYKHQMSHRQLLQQKLKNNLTIISKTRIVKTDDTGSEQVAKETLREMVSESEFRKYLKYGFVLVKSDSGATYQILKNKSHIKVWKGGLLIEEICVRLQGAVPPTDNLIAFKTMIETDEQAFRQLGNIYPMRKAA